jgi:hypothetical protein
MVRHIIDTLRSSFGQASASPSVPADGSAAAAAVPAHVIDNLRGAVVEKAVRATLTELSRRLLS